ncbi:helix-turn-helix domain-containing protein [Aliarcobacter cryaerophilus]|jgi:predicted transcriptional regulator|uniref:helix-turn-helix domain-containing protein n=1 Tax=Aliarcobacter cryaerophilus TaxID=28198 RepID=UPI0021B5DAE4|nr:helix-turn-helix transcriptional regulator [Aliarcobacter cryaerophilus]MCT7487236.1 helix-turn-helix domain-containing protein [Aliarcobacter cryaerophilus]MCT7491789.1 helix-turn-helix domain-containing protein [Aliarcobacter cryaerophilus]
MTRLELLQKIKDRRKEIGITIDNLSSISQLGTKTVSRFFTGADVKLSTVERITQVLGLDFAGNEVINIKALKEKRAEEKALYIVSLVQDTSALEMQGLESNEIKSLIEDTKKQFLTGKYKNTLWIN